jgi:GntR family transcriptional regulator / MocR family aminotransferase
MDLLFSLDLKNSKYPYKYQAIYHFLKDCILEGKLEIGTKLPSSREMARKYEVNRNTIKQVYEMLFADGYICTMGGSGTFVAYSPEKLRLMEKSNQSFHISEWATRIPADDFISPKKGATHFGGAGFSPDINHFPVEEWKTTVYQATRELNFLVNNQNYHLQGLLPLREAIAAYLQRTRGMNVNPNHMVIINGVMQGIGILSQLLIDKGDRVIVEEPSFQSIKANFVTSGATLEHVPVEPNGMQIENWDSRMIYVTPSHQFPTGLVMKLEERLKLLQWAKEKNAIIIEDDYDNEFQRKGRPIQPLKVLDYDDRVVFMGTFAKTILPSLRIGYIILPPDLIPHFLKARNLSGEYTTSIFEQMAAAIFIKTGRLERHLRRMNRLYAYKHDVFKMSLEKYQMDAFNWTDTNAGLHVFGTWRYSTEMYDLYREECLTRGVSWEDASYYYSLPATKKKVIFGFSHLSEEEISVGIETMGRVLKKM